MVRIYTGETYTFRKAKSIAAYPFHVVLLDFTIEVCRFLVDHSNTFAGLLSLSTENYEKNEGGKASNTKTKWDVNSFFIWYSAIQYEKRC